MPSSKHKTRRVPKIVDRYDAASFRPIPTPPEELETGGAVRQLHDAVQGGLLHWWSFGLQNGHLCSIIVQEPQGRVNWIGAPDAGTRPYSEIAATHLAGLMLFIPVKLPESQMQDAAFRLLKEAVQIGHLSHWEIGTRSNYICSRYTLGGPDGKVDWLMSGSIKDRDYTSLVRAHASRLANLLGIWKPSAPTTTVSTVLMIPQTEAARQHAQRHALDAW